MYICDTDAHAGVHTRHLTRPELYASAYLAVFETTSPHCNNSVAIARRSVGEVTHQARGLLGALELALIAWRADPFNHPQIGLLSAVSTRQ